MALIGEILDHHGALRVLVDQLRTLDLPLAERHTVVAALDREIRHLRAGAMTTLYPVSGAIPELLPYVRRGVSSHDHLRRTFDRMRSSMHPHAIWLVEFASFDGALCRHLDDEETGLHPRVEALVSPTKLETLAYSYRLIRASGDLDF